MSHKLFFEDLDFFDSLINQAEGIEADGILLSVEHVMLVSEFTPPTCLCGEVLIAFFGVRDRDLVLRHLKTGDGEHSSTFKPDGQKRLFWVEAVRKSDGRWIGCEVIADSVQLKHLGSKTG